MTPEEAKLQQAGDASVTGARLYGEATAAYYKALRANGLPPWYAIRLTLSWLQMLMASAAMKSIT